MWHASLGERKGSLEKRSLDVEAWRLEQIERTFQRCRTIDFADIAGVQRRLFFYKVIVHPKKTK